MFMKLLRRVFVNIERTRVSEHIKIESKLNEKKETKPCEMNIVYIKKFDDKSLQLKEKQN